ncbi:hypothetical protein M0P25_02800, partial [archaeon]|nr:hypothetical protein [archaeon]
NYTLDIGSVTSTSRVLMTLKEDGLELSSGLFKVNDEILFSGYDLESVIKVISVDQIDNSPDFVELSVGSDGLLELEHNKVLPGYGTSSDIQWRVEIDANADLKELNGITVFNDKKVWNVEDLGHDRAAATMDEVIPLPLNLGSIDFLGLTNENTYQFKVGSNEINWVDDRGREYTIPMYETSIAGSQKFGFNDYYFDDSNVTAGLKVYEGTSDTGKPVGLIDGNILTLDLEKDYDINYTVVKNDSTFDLAIMQQTADIQIGKNEKAKWNFAYSELDNNYSTEYDANYFAYEDNNVTGSGKALGIFSVTDDGVVLDVAIDLYTKDLVRKTDFKSGSGSSNVYTSQVDYNSEVWTLDQDHADDLRFAYTAYGSYAEVDGSDFMMRIPEFKRYLKIFIGGGATLSTELIGDTLELSEIGAIVEGENGTQAQLDSYDITAGAVSTEGAVIPGNWNVNNNRLVWLDQEAPSTPLIIVGGYKVNSLAVGTYGLEDIVTVSGQYVAGIAENNNLIVAGMDAADTAAAAKELITAIENM